VNTQNFAKKLNALSAFEAVWFAAGILADIWLNVRAVRSRPALCSGALGFAASARTSA